MTVKIALDAMGGDHAPRMVIAGAMQAITANPDVTVLLVGIEEQIRAEMAYLHMDPAAFVIHPASEVVGMAEKPAVALRTKKDSSMRVGVNLVKSGQVDALVSAGNTGALMATAKYVLKTLPGIERPAIASLLPSRRGSTLMLDLGANVDCTATHLYQFALMGEVFASALMGIAHPRVGLLNIGEEEMKGNEVVREAGERIKRLSSHYVGNIEGADIFLGDVDVVVCDGFVGNVSLKTGEGVAQMFSHFLKEAYGSSWRAKLGYLLARPALEQVRSRMDHRRYNGAMLLGLNGVVVKSHGSADDYAYSQAIQVAINLVKNRVNENIKEEVIRRSEAEGTP